MSPRHQTPQRLWVGTEVKQLRTLITAGLDDQEIGAEIGRTLWSVRGQIMRLRRRNEIDRRPTVRADVKASRDATMNAILREVANWHRISPGEVRNGGQGRKGAHRRQEAIWRMTMVKDSGGEPKLSLKVIGAFFGIHHTTALHAARAHAKRAGATYLERLPDCRRAKAFSARANTNMVGEGA